MQKNRRSLHPVIGEFLDDIGVHRLGIVDVQVAFRNRAVALLGKAAAVQRRRQPRVDFQRGVEISDCILVLPALEVDEAAAVERVDEIRPQPQRFVAILQRRLQVADDRACPAAVVEGFDILRVQPQ